MAEKKHTVVGLGELLWDMFPSGKKLGGAPANFAYIASLLGENGIPVSRVGHDGLGDELVERLAAGGLPTNFIQNDADHPTGTVKVEVDSAGQPRFEISTGVAWDFIEWTPQLANVARECDAVCFGSLAQRSPQSCSSIRNFLAATRPEAVRVFDVNLRQHFYDADVISDSLKSATIVKMNHEELPRIMQLFALEHRDEQSSSQRLAELFHLRLVCITRGEAGSLLVTPGGSHSHAGFRVHVADTVGAGDAFTAALVHEYLRGSSLAAMNDAANRMGAWVASQIGGMPAVGRGSLAQSLASIA